GAGPPTRRPPPPPLPPSPRRSASGRAGGALRRETERSEVGRYIAGHAGQHSTDQDALLDQVAAFLGQPQLDAHGEIQRAQEDQADRRGQHYFQEGERQPALIFPVAYPGPHGYLPPVVGLFEDEPAPGVLDPPVVPLAPEELLLPLSEGSSTIWLKETSTLVPSGRWRLPRTRTIHNPETAPWSTSSDQLQAGSSSRGSSFRGVSGRAPAITSANLDWQIWIARPCCRTSRARSDPRLTSVPRAISDTRKIAMAASTSRSDRPRRSKCFPTPFIA